MAVDLAKLVGQQYATDKVANAYLRWAIAVLSFGTDVKLGVHYMLYLNALSLFGNNETHSKLIEGAIQRKDLGCFALTEFHHGSYSKGIQTQAVYKHSTKEFVLNTQGTKGMKFWIGAAA